MTIRTKLDAGGRVIIPAQLRSAMGIKPGDEVLMALSEGELRIFSLGHAIQRAQELVRGYVPKGKSLADELIQDRRSEGAEE